MKEELTEEMHSELSVSASDELKFRTFTALKTIRLKIFTRADAIENYNVTEELLQEHLAEYESLQN